MSFEREQNKPFETVIPVRFSKALMSEFTDFAVRYLESIQDNPTKKTSFIRLSESPDRNVITFGYSSMPPAAFYTGIR